MRGTVHHVTAVWRKPILNDYQKRFHLGCEFSIAILRRSLLPAPRLDSIQVM